VLIKLKKLVLLVLLSLLFSTVAAVRFVGPIAAHPGEIIVPDHYPKIQWAIGNATDGDTIFVKAGTYYEHVVVYKPLKLIGEDSSTTIIDGSGEEKIVVRSNASDVEIGGFTIQNGGHFLYGIQIASCVRNTIRDNVIRNNNGFGIELFKSNNSVIADNKIMENSWGAGIYVIDSKNNDIHGNTITDNAMGVLITSSSSRFNTFYHNNFINNPTQAQSFGLNTWDNGAEGNYWSDYEDRYPNAEEIDGSGIWDTPYTAYMEVNDEYPLMKPWSLYRTFPVPWDGQTYYATTFCNATVASFKFNQSLIQISFNVTGPSDTISFCNVTIPNTLLGGDFKVLVNSSLTYYIPTSNATHNSLYFAIEFQSTSKVQIIATKLGSVITASVDRATVIVGSEVTINGTIAPVRVGVNVTISYRLVGGTWMPLATVTTASNSCYTYDWTTTETGIYEIKTSWEGDNITMPSESQILTIKVLPPPVHDIAVVNVMAPIEATVGELVHISAEVANEGIVDETFNVTFSYDTVVIHTQTVNLPVNDSTTVDFDWNTMNVAPGEYVINVTVPLDDYLDNNFKTTTIKLKPVVFLITVGGLEFNVVVESNSTVSNFEFREDQKEIRFSVTGPSGTVGFCNVTIPKELLKAEPPENWVVTVDGQPPTYFNFAENGTHAFLYFTFTHTTHNIIIRGTWAVPEFPTVTPLLLILIILAVFTITLKRRSHKTPLH